jgi:hypothetical protein
VVEPAGWSNKLSKLNEDERDDDQGRNKHNDTDDPSQPRDTDYLNTPGIVLHSPADNNLDHVSEGDNAATAPLANEPETSTSLLSITIVPTPAEPTPVDPTPAEPIYVESTYIPSTPPISPTSVASAPTSDTYGYSPDAYGYSPDTYGYNSNIHGYNSDPYGYNLDTYGYSPTYQVAEFQAAHQLAVTPAIIPRNSQQFPSPPSQLFPSPPSSREKRNKLQSLQNPETYGYSPTYQVAHPLAVTPAIIPRDSQQFPLLPLQQFPSPPWQQFPSPPSSREKRNKLPSSQTTSEQHSMDELAEVVGIFSVFHM